MGNRGVGGGVVGGIWRRCGGRWRLVMNVQGRRRGGMSGGGRIAAKDMIRKEGGKGEKLDEMNENTN